MWMKKILDGMDMDVIVKPATIILYHYRLQTRKGIEDEKLNLWK